MTFFKIKFFIKFFQEHYQSVKLFGYNTDQDRQSVHSVSPDLSPNSLKGYQQTTKAQGGGGGGGGGGGWMKIARKRKTGTFPYFHTKMVFAINFWQMEKIQIWRFLT